MPCTGEHSLAKFPGTRTDENASRDRTTINASQNEVEAIATVHGSTTDADGTGKNASGAVALTLAPSSPIVALARIHATATDPTDIHASLFAIDSEHPSIHAQRDPIARAEALTSMKPRPVNPIPTNASPDAATMTTSDVGAMMSSDDSSFRVGTNRYAASFKK
jgi:hypothetical protein